MSGRWLGLSVCFLLGFAVSAAGQVVYVDHNNLSGIEDGLSWATAFTTVQTGIDAASPGDEVWVASGVYGELRGGAGHEEGAIKIPAGVALYGGFAGIETARDQRDWESFLTVLDGSTARSGRPAYHVVIGEGNAVLDGFTVTGGNANGPGGSVYDLSGAARQGGGLYGFTGGGRIAHCTVVGNQSYWQGGGLHSQCFDGEDTCSISVESCVFEENFSTEHSGGAVYFRGVDAHVSNSRF